jgi:hypothetical protein
MKAAVYTSYGPPDVVQVNPTVATRRGSSVSMRDAS